MTTQQNLLSLSSILVNARKQQYDLLYVFCDAGFSVSQDVMHLYNGRLVDHKIIYELALCEDYREPTFLIRQFDVTDDKKTLYELAYQSGEYSRYRVDQNFGEHNFKRLYNQWVDNSISGELADGVFIHKIDDSITGFVSLKKNEDTGVIGLIATDKHYRGKGIGSALLNHVKRYAIGTGMTRLEVTTQGGNETACRFYEKNLFSVKSVSNVYHCWL
ncbi:GNAT family N-acetyltransferase [Spirosoma aureum]|uniref:GNAT family N-acetyltransferase n=1 Tax=Spirosoma aureum TaxID=2692134 RepID=A0A6G9AN54_9BACT|nr:GNAT family N-acetyltransferase [Spirosoma aureum]QIP13901.1 GNAT family N-acetyltransferase [Spirosoma aureum]